MTRVILIGAIGWLLLLAAIVALHLPFTDAFNSELVVLLLTLAALSATAWCLAYGRRRVKAVLAYAVWTIVATEGLLQIVTLAGWLPIVRIRDFVPYGRLYWTDEGYGNGMLNRYGWNYPEFSTRPARRRIVIIGDSYVAARQVRQSQNLGVILQSELDRAGEDAVVLAFGTHGGGPGHYVEMVKYAIKYLHPTDLVIMVYLGNDFANSTLALHEAPPDRYIYYTRTNGALALHPASRARVADLWRQYDTHHRALPFSLYPTLRSHLIIRSVFGTIRQAATERMSPAAPSRVEHFLSGNPRAVFERSLSDAGREALDIGADVLALAARDARDHGVTVRLATIPMFPPEFFTPNAGEPWDPILGGDDLLQPERQVISLAAREGIPVLAMGQYFLDGGVGRSRLTELYFRHGTGHLTPEGHEFFAHAMFERFFAHGLAN